MSSSGASQNKMTDRAMGRSRQQQRRSGVVAWAFCLLPLVLCQASNNGNQEGTGRYYDGRDDHYRRQQQQQQRGSAYNQNYYSQREEPSRENQPQQTEENWDYSRDQQRQHADSTLHQDFRGAPPIPPQQESPPQGARDGTIGSSYNPIHYEFQTPKRPFETTHDDAARHDDLPQTTIESQGEQSKGEPFMGDDKGDRRGNGESASPRNDAVTRTMSTKRGRAMLTLSSGTVGMALGAFVGKSLMNRPQPLMIVMFLVMAISTNILRNPYGELSRALGLALIYAFSRTYSIRRRYPTVRHIKACVRAGPRRNFPPSENPWQSDLEEFKMLQTVIAMAFVGSVCGGNLPLVPKWMGGMGGAGIFAFTTTLRNARGDLARTMGMRVVALVEEVIDINAELHLLRNMGTVGGRILDKLLILDRKHRIKDRMVSGFQWAYDQASRTASRVQSDIQGEEETENRNGERDGPPSRREEFRDGREEPRDSSPPR